MVGVRGIGQGATLGARGVERTSGVASRRVSDPRAWGGGRFPSAVWRAAAATTSTVDPGGRGELRKGATGDTSRAMTEGR